MTTGRLPRLDPSLTAATDAALDMSLRPFIERLVRPEKRERATSHFLPKREHSSYHELVTSIDETRARPCTPADIAGYSDVRGVLFVDHEAYSTTAKQAHEMYLKDTDAVFVAYGATFALLRPRTGAPLLIT
jgi:hypothetical protein